jgi:hypothetical protein
MLGISEFHPFITRKSGAARNADYNTIRCL